MPKTDCKIQIHGYLLGLSKINREYTPPPRFVEMIISQLTQQTVAALVKGNFKTAPHCCHIQFVCEQMTSSLFAPSTSHHAHLATKTDRTDHK